jgi:hypothetical protein
MPSARPTLLHEAKSEPRSDSEDGGPQQPRRHFTKTHLGVDRVSKQLALGMSIKVTPRDNVEGTVRRDGQTDVGADEDDYARQNQNARFSQSSLLKSLMRLANVPALTCGRNDTGGHAIRARRNERRARSEPAVRGIKTPMRPSVSYAV